MRNTYNYIAVFIVTLKCTMLRKCLQCDDYIWQWIFFFVFITALLCRTLRWKCNYYDSNLLKEIKRNKKWNKLYNKPTSLDIIYLFNSFLIASLLYSKVPAQWWNDCEKCFFFLNYFNPRMAGMSGTYIFFSVLYTSFKMVIVWRRG